MPADTGGDEVDGSLLFRVSGVFTITGRGLVAAGLVERGSIHSGDRVAVLHGAQRFLAVCRGVEMINVQPPTDLRTIGLLLPDLTKAEVAEGDLIVGA